MADDRSSEHRAVFDHIAFPVGLAFTAGFVDIFGFLAWYGLLTAHVTGNLIFIAVDIAAGRYDMAMKFLALPIFALSVTLSALLIEAVRAHGRPTLPLMLVLQAALIGLCLVGGLMLPPPQDPDSTTIFVLGSIALAAMGMQNATMRMILNDLPPTTVMTSNVTNAITEAVRAKAFRGETLTRRVKLIFATIAAFALGATGGALAEMHVGYVGLLVPIAALLALLPLAFAAMRAPAASVKAG